MKNKIIELINTKPKHYSKLIKNNNEMYKWVLTNSLINSTNFAEMIYSAVHNETNLCKNGNIKKFKSFNDGFIGCGTANKCKCVSEKVSVSVKTSKSNITKEQKEISNKKRNNTNIKKYGVQNVAQTVENRQKFKDWYANPENVQKNLERIKQTNIKKYGVENCKSLPEVEQKIIATCLARYGVTNVAQIPSTKAKLRARTAEYKLTKHLLSHGYKKFSNYIDTKYNFSLLTPVSEYNGINDVLKFRCNVCNTEKQGKFYYGRGLNCNNCNPININFSSNEEREVFDYIEKDLGITNGIHNNKSIIAPYELDMVFPEQKIAIEYCGLYWHSEYSSGKTKKYHYDKLKLANEKGYRLITIFSDEWNFQKNIVKSKLKHLFGKNKEKYYARKLTVKNVNAADSKTFLDTYHLQGNSSAKINLGLFYDNTLVALMTFSGGRAALNSKSVNNEYELVRYVTNGSSIVGGAGKLLSYFIKTYNAKKIISYADLRWSEGNVYETIGFVKKGEPTIGYWYVDGYKTRLHRFNFTKKQLVKEGNSPEKTEWEIMLDLGYDRIWDCGHQKFVYDVIID